MNQDIIPTDNAFKGATDGRGLIIQADPGEGVMIMPNAVTTENAALIRYSVRSNGPHASVYLASVEQGENTFVSTITPNDGAFFQDQYRRLSDFFIPPSSGFQPIIQVVNLSETEPLTVYLDNFEVPLYLGVIPKRVFTDNFLLYWFHLDIIK